jgi:hypothetical protein
VGASGQVLFYTGASPGSRLQEANLAQVGAAVIQAGLVAAADEYGIDNLRACGSHIRSRASGK